MSRFDSILYIFDSIFIVALCSLSIIIYDLRFSFFSLICIWLYICRDSMFIIHHQLCTWGLGFTIPYMYLTFYLWLNVFDSMHSTCISSLCLWSLLSMALYARDLRSNPKSYIFTSRSVAGLRQSIVIFDAWRRTVEKNATVLQVFVFDHANP